MRKNRGTLNGKFIGDVFEGWAVFQTDKGYRVSSKGPVAGKANYSFAITDKRTIDRGRNLDASTLLAERPELYAAIEQYFSGPAGPIVHPTANDEYGDLAESQRRPLTPDQQWKQALLQMRKNSLIARAMKQVSVFEAGIRMHYAGIYRFKIDDTTLKLAMNYVNGGAQDINLEALLTAIRAYHQGQYKPAPLATLDQQFDLIAGKGDNLDLLG